MSLSTLMFANLRRLEFLSALIFFSLFCCIILVHATPFLNLPGRDSGFFMYASQQLLQGKTLYVDVWDSKGPLIFFINALGLFIGKDTRWGVWVVEFLFWLASSLIGYAVMRRRWGVLPAFLGMSVFLLAGQRLIETGNFTEEYALLFTWISIYAFSQTTYDEHKRRYPIWIGAMLALNFLLRANNIGTAAVVALLYFIQAWQQAGLPQALKKSLWLLVGLLIILAPVAAHFIYQGTLDEMLTASILYNFDYSFLTRPNTENIRILQAAIFPGHKILRIWMLIPLAGFILTIFQAVQKVKTRQLCAFDGLLLLAWPIEIVASAISGRAYGHYFLLWLPVMGLLTGSLFYALSQRIFSAKFSQLMNQRKPYLGFLIGLLILVYTFPGVVDQYKFSFEQILFNRQQGIEIHPPIAQFIIQHTTPDEKVLVWGGQAGINFMSKRDSLTAYVFYPMLANSPLGKQFQDKFFDELRLHPPKLIIDAHFHAPHQVPSLDKKIYRQQKLTYHMADNLGDVLSFINQNYKLVAQVQGYSIYERRPEPINP